MEHHRPESRLEEAFEAEPFNIRDAIRNLAEYQEEHPNFAMGVVVWICIGFLFLLLGTILLLYSEIKVVLIVRDRDFRRRLVESGLMFRGSSYDDLEEKETAETALRPYLTMGAGLLLFFGVSCMLYPMCDILTIIGLPVAPCLMVLTVGSFFTAFCILTFWMGICWLCTRWVASVLLLGISLTGQLVLPTGNPILVFIWFIGAAVIIWVYFFLAPSAYEPKRPPIWLQDIGNLNMSLDPEEVSTAFNKAYEVHDADLKALKSKPQ